MKTNLVSEEYSRVKSELAPALARLGELASAVGGQGRDVAHGLIRNLGRPLLFVVVGEIKAGKSSLVNALTGDDICRVAPDPCTDKIHLLQFSTEPYIRDVSDYVVEIGIPSEVLNDIAIVDTPGTNSILERHQEITEQFVPEADLILFVFPALNPYPKTAWDFFGFIGEKWRKKAVFILQQTDRATQAELDINTARVEELARERGLEAPVIFPVSAKVSAEDPEAGGIAELRRFIRDKVAGTGYAAMKLESIATTALTLLDEVDQALEEKELGLASDRDKVDKVEARLVRGREEVARDMELFIYHLLSAYDRASSVAEEDFEALLTPANLLKNSFTRLIGRHKGLSAPLAEIQSRFNMAATQMIEEAATRQGKAMTATITRAMDESLDLFRATEDPFGASPRVSNLDTGRHEVIREVTGNVLELLKGESLARKLRPGNLGKLGDKAIAGGAVTTAGTIMAATVKVAFLDVTGSLFAAAGLIYTVHTMLFQRRTLKNRFKDGLDQGREAFKAELEHRLGAQIEGFHRELASAFAPFGENMDTRENELADLRAQSRVLRDELSKHLKQALEWS